MIKSAANSDMRRLEPLAVVVCVALIAAVPVQAQQQPAYPAPAQSYPIAPPAYPNPGYPLPNPTYPNSAYPNPAYPNPAYPSQQPGYPNPAYPGGIQPYPGYPGQPPPPPQPSHFFRDLFAQTLAVVMQTTSIGLLGTIAGRIMAWFTHKGYSPAAAPNGAQYAQYPNAGYPGSTYASAAPGYSSAYPTAGYTPGVQTPGAYAGAYPGAPQPYSSQATAYAGAPQVYPNQPTANATPAYGATPGSAPAAYGTTASSTPAPYGTTAPYTPAPNSAPAYGTAAPQVYDATTGQPLTGAANPYATRGVDMENAVYAGIAYEVEIIGADGQMTPVNTATYEFHTGDQFNLLYRPSLPGHMDIYNINAAAQKTLIDASEMAAGQLTTLGPYQFSNQTGDESLRLVLSPCTNPQLQAKTRDIVKLDSSPPATSGRTLKLPDCGAPTARGADIRSRDIQKVGVEDSTSFALDPLTPKEMISGTVAPREAIIVFHHR